MSENLIIHIDDNVSFRQNFKKMMFDKGFSICSFPNSLIASRSIEASSVLIAIVDSSGFDFAKRLRDESPTSHRIALSSNSITDPSIAQTEILKSGPWRTEVIDSIEQILHGNIARNRQRFDVFADPDNRERLRGKIAVVGGSPERILDDFNQLSDAITFIRKSDVPCRLVQGPPTEEFTLQELQGLG